MSRLETIAAHHRASAERGDGEIMALQAQDRNAEQEARTATASAAPKTRPSHERQVPLHHGDGDAVSAEAVEHRIAERGVAGVAADDVPALRQGREQQRVDAELMITSEPKAAGHARASDDHDDRDDKAEPRCGHAVFPSRPPAARSGREPEGRSSTTSRKGRADIERPSATSTMPKHKPPTRRRADYRARR